MQLLRRLRDLIGEDASGAAETGALDAIEERLGHLEPENARYVSAFAFVLARVAYADLEITATEIAEIRRRVGALASLSEEEAAIVADLARTLTKQVGGTQNYPVTREFRSVSTRAQRLALLECLFAVAAADGSIGSAESAEIVNIADELGFTRPETNAVRASWREHLAVLAR